MLAWLLGGDIGDPSVFTLYALGGFGPSAAAGILALRGFPGARRYRADRARRWLPVTLALGVAPLLAVLAAQSLTGESLVVLDDVAQQVSTLAGLLGFAATALVAGPLSEEFGWRGHAQPRLLRRFSPARTVVVLGAVWGLWHLPLFVLEGTAQAAIGLLTPAGLAFLLAAIPLSSLHWFVSERLRGGVPAAVLLHTLVNVGLGLVLLTRPVAGVTLAATIAVAAVLVHLPRRSSDGLPVTAPGGKSGGEPVRSRLASPRARG